MHENLGIGVAVEAVTFRLQFDSQLAEIVDGTIEDNADRLVGRKHRLVSGLAQIKDGETPVSEYRVIPNLQSFAVGTPPGQGGHHLPHVLLTRGTVSGSC
jgi:hypothetical protein